MDIKKTIRINFLDHLETWCEDAEERAKSVVSAKREELNSELDLRLHLHEPRSKRAEFDVHNVRAAELVMHSERVSRHCKGINQALTELKQRFGQMTEEHNQLALQFREDIEALEIVFINATKSSKLIALSNQLQIQQEKYMDKIRASLRQFRQHLDETLQMLRESNARFIKSFRVFSDGGNFCPEEIDEYRKKLEKMSQKIDSSEGFIMADLEGMESKRLEHASKVAREFEDRFKHHMVDLLFMEKIARWLTNTQVKIKAEVADSNSQAQRLAQHLDDLERKIDACERPNLDKEQITPSQLNDFIRTILDDFHGRSVYLDCQKEPSQRPSSATLQGNPALGARVAFLSDSIPPVSRPGKQPQEDPSVGVIKNILKTQKERARFGSEANPDGDTSGMTQQQVANLQSQNTAGNQYPDSKLRQPKLSEADTRLKTSSSKPGTASNSLSNEKVIRAQSGPHILASSLRSKPGKIDKKYYIFGEFHEEGEETNLIGRIKRILRESTDGLLSAAEVYYRQKGTRPVTRPQALQETLDDCAHVITQKLQSYHNQADEYHNQCLQEFRSQLSTLEDLVAHVPNCIIRELVQDSIAVARNEHQELKLDFDAKLNELDAQKRDNECELRPALGHPQKLASLESLCQREEQRREAFIQGVEEHAKKQQELAARQGREFLDSVARTSEQLLLQFDSLLTIDDVKKGRVPPVKFATSELLRRKYSGRPLDVEEETTKVTRGKNTWPGLPKNELVLPGSEQPVDRKASVSNIGSTGRRRSKMSLKRESTTTASVTTGKTTLGHTATAEARNVAFEQYKQYFKNVLVSIEEAKQMLLVTEQRWTENWAKSVEKIKALF
ncbi:hypothetical protein LSH36_21g05004 [Paralvinella palmiformis]|uniref:DUF4456 domain-containing protein n=1 Tax=Paralvinella palmiformis TaxID=53620 RepID=A0AAD9KBA9_9ANNE|nr:hypothetical protein LSH36_21g05004 [Paralvinella palmiformis]